MLETGEVGEVTLALRPQDVTNRRDPNHSTILFKLHTGASAAADWTLNAVHRQSRNDSNVCYNLTDYTPSFSRTVFHVKPHWLLTKREASWRFYYIQWNNERKLNSSDSPHSFIHIFHKLSLLVILIMVYLWQVFAEKLIVVQNLGNNGQGTLKKVPVTCRPE